MAGPAALAETSFVLQIIKMFVFNTGLFLRFILVELILKNIASEFIYRKYHKSEFEDLGEILNKLDLEISDDIKLEDATGLENAAEVLAAKFDTNKTFFGGSKELVENGTLLNSSFEKYYAKQNAKHRANLAAQGNGVIVQDLDKNQVRKQFNADRIKFLLSKYEPEEFELYTKVVNNAFRAISDMKEALEVANKMPKGSSEQIKKAGNAVDAAHKKFHEYFKDKSDREVGMVLQALLNPRIKDERIATNPQLKVLFAMKAEESGKLFKKVVKEIATNKEVGTEYEEFFNLVVDNVAQPKSVASLLGSVIDSKNTTALAKFNLDVQYLNQALGIQVANNGEKVDLDTSGTSSKATQNAQPVLGIAHFMNQSDREVGLFLEFIIPAIASKSFEAARNPAINVDQDEFGKDRSAQDKKDLQFGIDHNVFLKSDFIGMRKDAGAKKFKELLARRDKSLKDKNAPKLTDDENAILNSLARMASDKQSKIKGNLDKVNEHQTKVSMDEMVEEENNVFSDETALWKKDFRKLSKLTEGEVKDSATLSADYTERVGGEQAYRFGKKAMKFTSVLGDAMQSRILRRSVAFTLIGFSIYYAVQGENNLGIILGSIFAALLVTTLVIQVIADYKGAKFTREVEGELILLDRALQMEKALTPQQLREVQESFKQLRPRASFEGPHKTHEFKRSNRLLRAVMLGFGVDFPENSPYLVELYMKFSALLETGSNMLGPDFGSKFPDLKDKIEPGALKYMDLQTEYGLIISAGMLAGIYGGLTPTIKRHVQEMEEGKFALSAIVNEGRRNLSLRYETFDGLKAYTAALSAKMKEVNKSNEESVGYKLGKSTEVIQEKVVNYVDDTARTATRMAIRHLFWDGLIHKFINFFNFFFTKENKLNHDFNKVLPNQEFHEVAEAAKLSAKTVKKDAKVTDDQSIAKNLPKEAGTLVDMPGHGQKGEMENNGGKVDPKVHHPVLILAGRKAIVDGPQQGQGQVISY